ncbi:hypothetical protein DFH27DRAFT_581465 [Peziza echinospora]|nr:hypothetical protein DFH27DRAFT_581465 [Peziza echinospora]
MAAQPTWIADADDVQLDGASVSAIPVFAPLVIEVAYSESYEDAHADCADYLLSAAGKISLAILVRIKDPRRTRDTTAAAATTPPPSPRSTPPDSPDSASEAYEAIAEAVWRADRMQLEAFIECWELLPATATQQRQVALRCPRIWILKDGKRSSLVKVPMCRADFGLAGREMVDVDWTEFGMKIKDARMQTQVSSVIRERKVARAQRRVAVGDVGADYVPEATAW